MAQQEPLMVPQLSAAWFRLFWVLKTDTTLYPGSDYPRAGLLKLAGSEKKKKKSRNKCYLVCVFFFSFLFIGTGCFLNQIAPKQHLKALSHLFICGFFFLMIM